MTHLLDVVVGQSAAILELLASKDQSLLVRGDALLVLDLGLDIVDRVRGLNLKSDSLARKGLDEAIVCQSRIRRLRNFAVVAGQLWELFGELTSALFEGKY